MDKVQDESVIPEKTLSFEEDPAAADSLAEKGQVQISEEDTKISLSLWENHAPYSELNETAVTAKVTSPFKKKQRAKFRTGKPSEAQMKCHKVVSLIVAVALIVAIWGLLLLSPLCYFELGLCTNQTANVTTVEPILRYENCSIAYNGELCSSLCPSSLISSVPDNVTTTVQLLFSILGTATDTCKAEEAALKEFVCQYVYLPCNGNQPTLPSRTDCERLRDVSCVNEWSLVVEETEYSYLLPNCEMLPQEPQEINCSESVMATAAPTINNANNSSDGIDDSVDAALCAGSYSDSVCQSYITLCPDSGIHINSSSEELSAKFETLDSSYNALIDGECKAKKDLVLGFLCQYTFQPCDDSENVLLPSKDTCEQIRDVICPEEIQNLPTIYSSLVPDCSILPDEQSTPYCETTIVEPTLVFVCNEEEGFYLQNGTCQPRCNEWTTTDSGTSMAIDAIVLLSTLIAIIGGFAVIFFSLLRHERVCTFPSAFIVYLTIELMIIGVFVLVQYMDRRGLSCSPDNNLITTLENPTTFCTVSGFVVYYCLFAVSYWWFVHIVCTFWKVMWPFHARRHQDKHKYIHAILLWLGIILPFIPAVTGLLVDGYTISKFPPILCIGENSAVAFYSLVLPICIIGGLGITFLIIILYTLQQKSGVFQHRQSAGLLNLSAAEKKLLLIFFYYIFLAIIDITLFNLSIANLDEINDAIFRNFLCEAVRTNAAEECPKLYKEIRISETLYIMTYLLLGLFPTINLLFAINIREVKVKFKHCLRGRTDLRSRTTSTTVPTPETPFSLQRIRSYSLSRGPSSSAFVRENGTIGRAGTYIPNATSSSVVIPRYEGDASLEEPQAETRT